MSIMKTLFSANAIGNTFSGITLGGSFMLVVNFLEKYPSAVGSFGIFTTIFIQWYFKRKADRRAEEAHDREMEKKNDT